MTVEELANTSNIRSVTVQRNISSIPGYDVETGNIPNGSRWKFNMRNVKLNNREKKMYYLLKATNEFKYVDCNMLRMTRESFETMIAELVNYGLLIDNGTNNIYGANRYDTTMQYEKLKALNMQRTIQNIAGFIGTMGAAFVAGLN